LIHDFLGVPPQVLFGQLLLGLINGSFYATLSLGLAVIFGLLNIINFTHGAQYMMGAFAAWMLLTYAGIGYWWSLILAPLAVGLTGLLIERNLISQLNTRDKSRSAVFIVSSALFFLIFYYGATATGILGFRADTALSFGLALLCGLLTATAFGAIRKAATGDEHVDHLYGLLLTFGLALVIQGLFTNEYGVSGIPYTIPHELSGGWNLGFMYLPIYRGWVVVASLIICFTTWLIIEKTKLGAYLRAATENPALLQAFGVNVPRLVTLTYGFGVALAALAGVLAAPIYSVNPHMGADLIIVVFAVVVIGGMGSVLGSIITGFGLGIAEGLTKVFYPEASATVIFVIMAIALLAKPAGLFGKAAS
jgi:branched-chain amino acid transport system permease protein